MPPALNILLTPAVSAANRIAGCTFPSLPGGVQSTISLQPAIRAGTANIRTVEKRGAVPPGMYRPTFSMATAFCQQVTPGAVSTFFPVKRCEAWNISILSFAWRMACFSSSGTSSLASANSCSETCNPLKVAGSILSNFSSYRITAASPPSRTSSSTVRTVSNSVVTSNAGR